MTYPSGLPRPAAPGPARAPGRRGPGRRICLSALAGQPPGAPGRLRRGGAPLTAANGVIGVLMHQVGVHACCRGALTVRVRVHLDLGLGRACGAAAGAVSWCGWDWATAEVAPVMAPDASHLHPCRSGSPSLMLTVFPPLVRAPAAPLAAGGSVPLAAPCRRRGKGRG